MAWQLAWKTRSLRFWLTAGLVLAILPLAASAVIGHFLLKRHVIAPFADVADRQRYQLTPANSLESALLEAMVPIDEFVDDGDPTQPPAYRLQRERIEAAYGELHKNLQNDLEPRTLLERSRDDWTAADAVATELISVRRPGGDPRGVELMQRFHGLMRSAVDKLSVVTTEIEVDIVNDHDEALLVYERSEWLAGIAAVVSLLALVASVLTIGRVVSASIDRLVAGAERFAGGDRAHRIEVQIPPELRGVAEEFNRMIGRIHESEEVLADLAHRDGLTKLPNRRAFDDALSEMFARMDRLGETGSLLMIDIDHFKQINDTHGHSAGDEVLRAVARKITSDLRMVDHVFRVGGEEFAAILAGANVASAQTTAERLRHDIATVRVAVKSAEISVTVSIGVATAGGGSVPSVLVEAADVALYRAKREGRNRVVISSAPNPAAPPASASED